MSNSTVRSVELSTPKYCHGNVLILADYTIRPSKFSDMRAVVDYVKTRTLTNGDRKRGFVRVQGKDIIHYQTIDSVKEVNMGLMEWLMRGMFRDSGGSAEYGTLSITVTLMMEIFERRTPPTYLMSLPAPGVCA